MIDVPDSKVHGANMGPIWGRQDPGGPHVGPMNCAICGNIKKQSYVTRKEYLNDVIFLYMFTIKQRFLKNKTVC